MITTTPAWDAKNAALAKRPIYVFAIGGLATVYSTHDLTREGIAGAPAFRAWLKVPRGASQSIDVIRGQSSIGELECEVVDRGGEVRELVGTTVIEGRSATLSVGYPGLAYAEFVPLHTYQSFKVTPSRSGYTSWLFRSRDRQMALKRTIRNNPLNGAALSEENPWVVQGTPAEIVQAVYLFALGRDAADLDLAGMAALDSAVEGMYKAARPYRFVMTEPAEAKQFLETEIYQVAGIYPVVTNTGKISLRAPRPPAAGPAAVFEFTPDNMIVLPQIDRAEIVNEMVFAFDHDGDDFLTELVYVDGGSISTYGRARQLRIESKGLRSELGAQWFCHEAARRIFRRFAGVAELKGGAAIAQVEAFLLSLPVWTGDYVLVSHPKMPDLTTGALGVVERLYEVIDREPDYARGRMRYKLLDTGLTGRQGAYGWSPCARPFVVGESEVY